MPHHCGIVSRPVAGRQAVDVLAAPDSTSAPAWVYIAGDVKFHPLVA